MTESLLEVKNLKKYFPITAGLLRRKVGEIKAVDGVDFTLAKGEVLGLVGESGSGKSTIARAAMRLIQPTQGSISFGGIDLMQQTPEELKKLRPQMQLVFQDPYASLNPRKTIGENIGEALLYHQFVKSRTEQRERIVEILRQVGLPPESIGLYPHAFSGGQQQRICIGRAIAVNPRLVICDEAVSALDVSVQAQIINLFMELKERLHLSYLFISHDLSIIRHICDRVIVLYLGKVMESASTEELFSNPQHPYTQALLSAVPKNHPHEKKSRIILSGEIPSASNPPSGCPFRTRCPYAQPQCALTPPHRIINDKGTGKPDHHYHCILEPNNKNVD